MILFTEFDAYDTIVRVLYVYHNHLFHIKEILRITKRIYCKRKMYNVILLLKA